MDMGGLRQHLNALDTVAECLSHTGDDVGALVTVENALSILAIAKERSDDLPPEEALLHRRRAFILIRLRRFGPALASATILLALAQQLAFEDEARFAPFYFDAVCSLIECRTHLGIPYDSDALVDEAIVYFETLVAIDPKRFMPGLIDRLIRLSAAVATETGSDESLALAKRAAELAEEYTIAHPSSTAVDCARVFSQLGEIYLAHGDLRAASDAMRIAAGGSRPCPAPVAVTDPDEVSSNPPAAV
jgi:tetratricopeptide (TPR) repeat protein